jgi:hypothetical protein
MSNCTHTDLHRFTQNTHLLAKALLDNVKLLVELLVDVVVVPDFSQIANTPKKTRVAASLGKNP